MKVLGRGSIASWLEMALNVVSVILWIALIGVVVGAIAFVVIMGLMAAGVIPATLFQGGHGHVAHGADADITFTMDKGMAWQVLGPTLLTAVVAVSGGLIIVNRLKRLFASFRSAEPFRKENATHLRVIWVTMTAIELCRYALLALTGLLIAAFGAPAGVDVSFNLHVNLMTWVAILVIIVLAEVFREGARLREEQDLTV